MALPEHDQSRPPSCKPAKPDCKVVFDPSHAQLCNIQHNPMGRKQLPSLCLPVSLMKLGQKVTLQKCALPLSLPFHAPCQCHWYAVKQSPVASADSCKSLTGKTLPITTRYGQSSEECRKAGKIGGEGCGVNWNRWQHAGARESRHLLKSLGRGRAKELFHDLLQLGSVSPCRRERFGDDLEAGLGIRPGAAVHIKAVPELLDDLAAVPYLVEPESSGRTLKKVTKAGEFLQIAGVSVFGFGLVRQSTLFM